MSMHIISVRANPHMVCRSIAYFQLRWANENSMAVYEDCIVIHSMHVLLSFHSTVLIYWFKRFWNGVRGVYVIIRKNVGEEPIPS